MSGIKETEIEGEKIHLKKSFDGWRVVHPIKLNGQFNVKNILTGGSWWNVVKTALFIFLILFAAWSYDRDVEYYRGVTEQCLGNPCKWCDLSMKNAQTPVININYSQYFTNEG